ncbi:MAG: hypothetical protein KatS3mg110_0607 [Pirellulaceae bacterium]|nr:MAG: hypothetical protein KatS3mg110_0607 [Pirellulaceae bacterium]
MWRKPSRTWPPYQLTDAVRNDSRGNFSAEKATHILAVACELPELSGRPIDRETQRESASPVSGCSAGASEQAE